MDPNITGQIEMSRGSCEKPIRHKVGASFSLRMRRIPLEQGGHLFLFLVKNYSFEETLDEWENIKRFTFAKPGWLLKFLQIVFSRLFNLDLFECLSTYWLFVKI